MGPIYCTMGVTRVVSQFGTNQMKYLVRGTGEINVSSKETD